MYRIKEFLSEWLIPPAVYRCIKKIKRKTAAGLYGTGSGMNFTENEKFRNIHNGRRCFILATGPSVKDQDLSGLSDEICIAVSHFHLHPDIRKIAPAYHVLAPQHSPFTFEDSRRYFDDFIKYYSGSDVIYFLGLFDYEYSYSELLKKYPEYRLENTYFLNYASSVRLTEENYIDDDLWNIAGNPFAIRTVIYSAVQLAVYMGFNEIYLLGCDHNYLDDISTSGGVHFYPDEAGIPDKEQQAGCTTERLLKEYYERWKDYRFIKQYAVAKRVKIYNATKGGMLDVFDRIELADVLV